MYYKWLREKLGFHNGDGEKKGHKLYAIGPLEITLIVVAVILVFGVGKLANVGGALGKSIREFRKEKEKVDEAPTTPKLTTKETKKEESTEPEAEPEEESKD